MELNRGDRVVVKTAFGTSLERVALTGQQMGHSFPVIWLCDPEEWATATGEGREPEGLPWPAEDVLRVHDPVSSGAHAPAG